MVKAILEYLAEQGSLVAPEAAEYLADPACPRDRIEAALRAQKELPFILTSEDLRRLAASAGAAPEAPRPAARLSTESLTLTSIEPPADPRPQYGQVAQNAAESPTPASAPVAVLTPQAPAAAPAPPVPGPEPAAQEPVRLTAAPLDAITPAAKAVPASPALGALPRPGPVGGALVMNDPLGGAIALPRKLGDVTSTPLRIIPGDAKPFAREGVEHSYVVDGDVTGNSTSEGAISDFTRYFTDRLTRIRKMLRQRREMVGCVPIKNIRASAQAEIKIVGLVSEVRTTKNGHRLIELEDETGSVAVLAPQSDHRVLLDAQTLIEDEVVGLICKPPGRGDLLILQGIVRPEIPQGRAQNRSERGSAVAFVSDVHIGAKTFLQDDWDRFVSWINGEAGDSRQRALARKTKYLVVVGDLVDGIGIFPGQEDELAIVDGLGQYQKAGDELRRIRSDVKIFVLPGNHDLVRPAEPQPAFPEKYRKCFDPNVVHLGNPCKLTIEGVEILNYHGRSFDDWIMRVQGLTYQEPLVAMEEMLKRRHVLPIYGLRTPIAPEHKDYLVIDTVPDIFVTGHVHAAGIKNYRGVTLINSSCWQSQTSYQKMHGFNPEPSLVPVVELDTGRNWLLDFHRNKPAGTDANSAAHFVVEGGASARGAGVKAVLPSVEF